ncbi:MAG: TrkH family potassium uptake protein [Bacteroidetes bacterium]|uniref:TrkH family potassium uptake protein n=1 Tax=Candidatus Egerieousia excrementavium TaxID=2840778 RepID=A0A9D9DND4_9BACT|nr:TrkH family potassium uptake protein [Candidatus Egerieousia excrementavium]
MNLSVVARNIGIALLSNAVFMFLGVIVSIVYGFDSSFSPLLLSGVITLIAGLFPLVFVRKSNSINAKEGFTIVVFAWVLSCLFGMLPYVLWGGEFTLINAWYESVSGYTTCGGTILSDVESLPKGLLFWRSSTHFLGGLGIVVFMLLVLPSVSSFSKRLKDVETSSLSQENYRFRTKQTIYVMFSVYFGITIAETLCLMLAGMDFFNAINHAFSTVATGGFSTLNDSVKGFDSVLIEYIIIFFMLLSGLHFGLIYSSVTTRSLKIFRSPVVRYYIACVFVFSVAIAVNLLAAKVETNWGEAISHSLFQAVSVSTSTGFATSEISTWPNFAMLLMLFLMIQGACSGSTTGGVKADRFLIFFKSIKAQLKKYVHPNAVMPVKVGKHTVDYDLVSSVNLFILFYFLILFAGTLVLTLLGVGMEDAVSSVISNTGNVGVAFGEVGSFGNYGYFPAAAKFVLALLMLIGRFEIFSFIVIFVIYKWR